LEPVQKHALSNMQLPFQGVSLYLIHNRFVIRYGGTA
jgi:hypothetical protein